VAGPTADIQFLCTAHANGTPVVTLHQGLWAYCRGGEDSVLSDHVWVAIPAMRLSELKGKQLGSIREGSVPETEHVSARQSTRHS